MTYLTTPGERSFVLVSYKMYVDYCNQHGLNHATFSKHHGETSPSRKALSSMEESLSSTGLAECTWAHAKLISTMMKVDVGDFRVNEPPEADQLEYRAPLIVAIGLLSRSDAPLVQDRDQRCAFRWLNEQAEFQKIVEKTNPTSLLELLEFRGHLRYKGRDLSSNCKIWGAYSIPDGEINIAIQERAAFERRDIEDLLKEPHRIRRAVAERVEFYLKKAKPVINDEPHHLIRYDELIHACLVRDRHKRILYEYRLVSRQIFAQCAQHLLSLTPHKRRLKLTEATRVHRDFYDEVIDMLRRPELPDHCQVLQLYDEQIEELYKLANRVSKIKRKNLFPNPTSAG